MPFHRAIFIHLCAWILFLTCEVGASETIRAELDPRFPPFVSINEQGKVDGYAAEVLRLAAAEIGQPVAIEPAPWQDVLRGLDSGRLDVVPMIVRTEAYAARYDFTIPFLTLPQALFIQKHRSDIRFLEDTGNERIAVVKGEVELSLLESLPGRWKITQTKLLSEAFSLLEEGKVDSVIASRLVGSQLLRSEGFDQIQIVNQALGEGFQSSYAMAIPKGQAEQLALWNEALVRLIMSGKLQSVRYKWLQSTGAHAALPPIVTYGIDQNYPPYEFIDQEGKPTGFNVELARAVADEIGVSILFEANEWEKTLEQFNAGGFDMTSMTWSEERARNALFSMPHSILRIAIFARDGVPVLQDLKELKGHRLAVIRGDMMHDYVLKLGLESKLILTANLNESLALLSSQEVDYAIGEHLQGLSHIKQFGWQGIRVDDHHVREAEYCFAFNKDFPALQLRYDIGLREVTESGIYHEIYTKWLGILEPKHQHFPVWKYIAPLLIIISVLALIAFFLITTLRRLVRVRTAQLRRSNESLEKERTKAIQLYKESEQSKRTLERTKFALSHISDQVLWLYYDGNLAYVNEANCQKLGYSRDELLQMNIGQIDPNFPPERWHLFWRELKHKGRLEFEASCQRKDGSIYPVEVHAWHIDMNNQQFCFAIARDITKRNAQLQ